MSKNLPIPFILEVPNMNVSEVARRWLHILHKGITADDLRQSGMVDDIPEGFGENLRVPDYILTSPEWKTYLFELRKTGRARDDRRYKVMVDWLWQKVLPLMSDVVKSAELENLWNNMLVSRDTTVMQTAISTQLEKVDPEIFKALHDQNRIRLAKVAAQSDAILEGAEKEMAPYNEELLKYQNIQHSPAKKLELLVKGATSNAVCVLNVSIQVENFWEKVDITTCFRDLIRLDVESVKI